MSNVLFFLQVIAFIAAVVTFGYFLFLVLEKENDFSRQMARAMMIAMVIACACLMIRQNLLH